jgi:hypothetical protein
MLCHAQKKEDGRSLQAGGNVVTTAGKWDWQNRLSFLKAKENMLVMLESELAYGFTDHFGIDIDSLWVLLNKKDGKASHGIGDLIIYLTTNLTTKETFFTTVKIGAKFPTGNPDAVPPTGTGSFDFASEIDVNHESDKWYFSFKQNMLLAGHFRNKKNGNAFSFEIDYGPHFKTKNDHHFFLLWELVAEYAQQDVINGVLDDTSGGFLLRTGPRFTWQKDDFVQIQIHFNVPIGQVPNGIQPFVDLRSEFLFEIKW